MENACSHSRSRLSRRFPAQRPPPTLTIWRVRAPRLFLARSLRRREPRLSVGRSPTTPTDPSGVAGGLQAGYNVQCGQFVFGGETDLQLSDADDRFAPWKFSNPWFGTLRGRAGIALNNMMFYGTVGLAYGTLRAQNMLTGVSESHTSAGWAGGAGMEVALMGNWTARAEYLYVDLATVHSCLTGTNNGLDRTAAVRRELPLLIAG